MSSHFESLLSGLSADARKEIATVPERFVQRALDGDWDGVANLYHPAAIQMPPDQPAIEGHEAIGRAMSQTFGGESGVSLEDFSIHIREAEAIGELIYVRAAYRLKMTVTVGDETRNLEQHGPYINLLRRDNDGHWRIYRQIYGRDHPPSMFGSVRQSVR